MTDEGKVGRRQRRAAGAIMVVLAVVLLATAGGSAAAKGPGRLSYTYVEIGVLGVPPTGSPFSTAYDINDAGQAIGTSTTSRVEFEFHSFVTTDGSSLTDLGVFNDALFASTFATAINEAGDIVGYAHVNPDDPPHAFLYRNGQLTDLGTGFGSGSVSTAYDINDAGLIVGSRRPTQSDPERAVIWQDGAITPLPGLGGTARPYEIQDRAEAVNGFGDVVGTARATNGDHHAALWRNGQVQDLGAQFGDTVNTYARDVNDARQVLIEYVGDSVRAKVWRNGVVRDIGGFFPSGINSAGQAVGTAVVAGAGGASFSRAVIAKNGRVLDLNRATTNLPSGVTLGVAEEINDTGVIVGYSCTNECELGRSVPFRGFLLIPN